MTERASVTDRYRAARDQLLDWRDAPDRAREEFVWPDLGTAFCWAIDWFDVIARDNEQPALVICNADGTHRSWSFEQMRYSSDQVAAWLSTLGIGKDDAVVVMLSNQVELWETMLALMKLGAVIMPTTSALNSEDLAERIARGGARMVICNPGDAPKVRAVKGDHLRVATGPVDGWHDLHSAYANESPSVVHPRTSTSDRLLMYFTSGTTRRPKLVEHDQVSYPVGHLSTMFWLGLKPGDVHLNLSSPGWAKHAWSSFFAPWIAEATVVVSNYQRFDPAQLRAQLQDFAVTSFCAPPTVWRMLIQTELGGRPPHLREAISAGEPLNPEVIAQVQRSWGVTIRDGYGQTETTAQVGNCPGDSVVPGAMGKPLPGVPVVLVDPGTSQEISGAGEGELCLKLSPHPLPLMTGYGGDTAGNALAMAGGYYHSGDLARRDHQGTITYVGRTDDVFKASDYKISPFELESVLIEHPAVAEAAVVPAPDPLRLAVPKAYIALAAGFEANTHTALDIFRFAKQRLAPYQRLRRLEFAELPKTISGKIRRVELRNRETSSSERDRSAEWRDDQFPELVDPARNS